ncbi:Glycosyltransferase involved in cell wall bisynthesis [Xylanibacter ruminicola]|uniref:Glycosyltransferase involved in cell wall bisynthesis n=1 Tax=Xylanibacter ruminicola TaxID=839 RepID=A0A1M7GSQ2_XYLRU|nr:glycosyltransferase family 4 protein [Xylanibacter ruminicola]SHM19198.1 Glycosyltransferase involved in cell wall bisynthesis [Xylanibacter ruminicola]
MRDGKYKIVYCTPALYSAGGTERVVSVKANYFADVLGYDVTVIVTEGKNGNSFFPLSNKVKVINLGLNFEELWNISFFRKILLYLHKQRKYRKLLTKELMSIRPDVTITTLRREINFINSINDGSKKIGEQHLSRTNYRKIDTRFSKYYEKLFFWWWKDRVVSELVKLNRLVVLTNDAVSEWPELANIRMIPDPLSLKVDGSSSLTTKRVITIGRYSYEKGYDILLRIWSVVEKKCTDWQLDVYAMGDPTPYVKLMDDLSIDKRRCHLHSSVVDVEDEYLKSSILVQPSRTEGFGLVIVEAMACGLPVLSFDCENGPRSIISDGEEGFLIPTFDIEEFSNRLIQLMNDADLRKSMGEKGRKKSQCYQIESVGNQWKQLFDELMQKDGI